MPRHLSVYPPGEGCAEHGTSAEKCLEPYCWISHELPDPSWPKLHVRNLGKAVQKSSYFTASVNMVKLLTPSKKFCVARHTPGASAYSKTHENLQDLRSKHTRVNDGWCERVGIYISIFVYRIMMNNNRFYIDCVCKDNSYVLLQDNHATPRGSHISSK